MGADRPECRERREVVVPDCKEKNEGDCRRAFHIYLPGIICGDDGEDGNDRGLEDSVAKQDTAISGEESPPLSLEAVGTLPLVFAIHCYGCTASSITSFIAHANFYNVVLVLPEGLHNSFNARHCCGYALENEIDDVGFLKHIQSTLSEEYKFVDADISYAVGWSNGGFMVTHAASLFRSISPISGHVYDIDPALKKGGTFCVDGICVDSPGPGKGIFLHHGADDPLVRPTGCCKDPDLPQCCCDIAADTCVPVQEVATNWASEVNGCAVEKGEGDDKDDAGPTFATTYSENGIECQTAIGSDCKANTTICLHEKAGHFNSPSFIEKFPFAKEVIDFFAREACGINDGKWNATRGFCTCSEDQAGQFCLNDPVVAVENVDMESDVNVDDFYLESGAQPSKGSNHLVSGLLLVMVALAFVRHRYKTGAKKDDRYSADVIDEDMEEQATELVSSRGLHMS
ncbi:hypothetical protein ACHAXT_002931 [Thalassiosira profunda]